MRAAIVCFLCLLAVPARADDKKTADKLNEMIEELARIEGAADDCSGHVRDRIAEVRGRMKALRDDLRGTHGDDPPPAPTAMDDKAFDKLKKRVDGESFTDGKLRVIRDAAGGNHFRSAQVGKLLAAIAMNDDRLKALDALAPRIVDRNNTFEILKAFDFDADKKKAEAILKRTK